MVRKRTSKEWTTIRINWQTKKLLQAFGIGRETDDEILKRIIKEVHGEEVIKENSPENREYEEKLNRAKRTRKR